MREAELFNLLDGAAEAAFVVDQEGIIRFWNQSATKLFGLEAGGAVHRPCASILCGLDAAGDRVCGPECAILQLAQNGTKVAPYDLDISTASGERRWVNISVLVANTQGKKLLVHLVRDIHSRKQLEQLTRQIVVQVGQLTGQQAEDLIGAAAPAVPRAGLTPQEHRILKCLGTGRSTAAIARELHISLATSRNHIQHIMSKLRAHTRLEAVMRARRERLI